MFKTFIRFTLGLLLTLILALLVLFFYNVVIFESQTPKASAPPSSSFSSLDGETLSYRVWQGESGETVFIVGGLSSWAGTWERTIEAERERGLRHTFVVLDLPPFGYSEPDGKRGYTRDIQASRIKALIDEMGYERVIMIAHSYGAGPSMEYALRNPEHVSHMVLIDPVLNVESEERSEPAWFMRSSLIRSFFIGLFIHNDAFATKQLKSFVYIPDHIDEELLRVYTRYFDTDGVTKRFSSWLIDYLSDPLDYVSTQEASYEEAPFPVSLIWGEEDTLTPIEEAEILMDSLPRVTMHSLQGVGHIPMIEDLPLFDATLFEVLKN